MINQIRSYIKHIHISNICQQSMVSFITNLMMLFISLMKIVNPLTQYQEFNDLKEEHRTFGSTLSINKSANNPFPYLELHMRSILSS